MAQEKTFENRIKKYLTSVGAWHLKYWAGAQFTKSGIPDILSCVNGYFVAIEVKAQEGKPTELQLHTIQQIRQSGGFAFVLYPSGYEKFKSFIDNLKKGYFEKEMEVILK